MKRHAEVISTPDETTARLRADVKAGRIAYADRHADPADELAIAPTPAAKTEKPSTPAKSSSLQMRRPHARSSMLGRDYVSREDLHADLQRQVEALSRPSVSELDTGPIVPPWHQRD